MASDLGNAGFDSGCPIYKRWCDTNSLIWRSISLKLSSWLSLSPWWIIITIIISSVISNYHYEYNYYHRRHYSLRVLVSLNWMKSRAKYFHSRRCPCEQFSELHWSKWYRESFIFSIGISLLQCFWVRTGLDISQTI